MKIDELKKLFLVLRKWERKNKDIIGKPIRTRHFIEDLALIIHFYEEESFTDSIIKMKRAYAPERLARLFGIKSLEVKNK